MKSVNTETLIENINLLKGRKVLVVGDVGLDEYVMGQVKRISPEAPVPVVEVTEEDERLGLASNTAANVASLLGEPWLVGIIGSDGVGDRFKALLEKNNCTSRWLIPSSDRPTTRKLRVMAGHHHVVRVDYEKKSFISKELEAQVLNQVENLIPKVDAVIIEDYAKGLMSERVIQGVISVAHKNKKIVLVDPHRTTPLSYYRGADFMTPNTDEAISLSGLKFDDLRNPSDSLKEVGHELMNQVQGQGVVITRGPDGMSAFTRSGPETGQHIPTFARSVFDVTGAGDTVIATLTLALAAGLDLETSCILANYAAGVVVGKRGCVTANPTELVEYIESHKTRS